MRVLRSHGVARLVSHLKEAVLRNVTPISAVRDRKWSWTHREPLRHTTNYASSPGRIAQGALMRERRDDSSAHPIGRSCKHGYERSS